MAQTIVFGNKVVKLPGTYARVVSGVKREIPSATYSNVLIIDAGAGNGYNSVKGIVGNGRECIYKFDQQEVNYYVKGGPLEPVIEALYNPDKGKRGIGSLYLIKAAKSTPASAEGPISLFDGAIVATSCKTVEEGDICNTALEGKTLIGGFEIKAIMDKADKKAYIEVHQGTYKGTNYKGYAVGEVKEISTPIIIYRSKRCSTPKELVNYLSRSREFKALFKVEGLEAKKEVFLGTEKEVVLTFKGGKDTYEKNLNEILPNIVDVDYSCLLVLEPEDKQITIPSVIKHIKEDSKGVKQVMTFQADKDDAITKAIEYDTDSLIVTSGVVKKTSKASPTGFITHDAMVTAAYALGRIFGLSPEISGTMKSLGIDGMEVEPTDKDLEDMLENGVISPYFDTDFNDFVLSQVCNSLQENTELINDDATTYSVQAKRILAQVLKNLTRKSKLDFWDKDKGVNHATLSDAYLKAWTETELEKLTYASDKAENNYLIDYEVVRVVTNGDSKEVQLAVRINGEVTKVFFLVTILG